MVIDATPQSQPFLKLYPLFIGKNRGKEMFQANNLGSLVAFPGPLELEKADYKAITNQRFVDPDPPHKTRECDIYAYKEVPLHPMGSDAIYPTLVCECKNFHQPTVFIVKGTFKETYQPRQDEVRVSGIPAKIWQRDKYIPVQEFMKCGNFHHYCKLEVPVATQYCCEEK